MPAPIRATPIEQCVDATRAWLERAVIGLNLCPFAKAVHVRGQIHYAVTQATTREALRLALEREINELVALDPSVRDTTLLIVPQGLGDFLDFNDFLDQADQCLAELGQTGVLQIASFHPGYQFFGTATDDISNYTNRSPYPTLHLIREASIDRAVQAFPQAETIYEKNIATLEKLGPAGWDALKVGSNNT